jgi:hypothetical protein
VEAGQDQRFLIFSLREASSLVFGSSRLKALDDNSATFICMNLDAD